MIGHGIDAILDLSGDPLTRGRGQAKAGAALVAAARNAIRARLADARAVFMRDDIRAFLAEQSRITAAHDPAASLEIAGIATALDIDVAEVFAHLHLGTVADQVATDGCSAFAAPGLLAKNRDYRGRHLLPQVLYRLADPTWRGRRVLCLGSLGAPGAYSSGLNSDGLALADTQIATRDSGPGLLRYFVMTRLLAECADVPAALDKLRSLTHAGGGSLVLADAAGRIAAVEFGHRVVAIEQAETWVARSNHFVSPELSGATRAGDAPARASTRARLATLRAALGGARAIDPAFSRALLTGHDAARETLCRHGEGADSLTLAAVVIAPALRRLSLAASPPCRGVWQDFTLTEGVS